MGALDYILDEAAKRPKSVIFVLMAVITIGSTGCAVFLLWISASAEKKSAQSERIAHLQEELVAQKDGFERQQELQQIEFKLQLDDYKYEAKRKADDLSDEVEDLGNEVKDLKERLAYAGTWTKAVLGEIRKESDALEPASQKHSPQVESILKLIDEAAGEIDGGEVF